MGFCAVDTLVLDVDGVLTDGAVAVDAGGDSLRVFQTQDGCAIKLWQQSGRACAMLTGRESIAVEARARALGIAEIVQGAGDKGGAFDTLVRRLGWDAKRCCYVGDDLPDIGPMQRCGFAVAVSNAVPAVKTFADYVTLRTGGQGAVAEVIELLLRKQGVWPSHSA